MFGVPSFNIPSTPERSPGIRQYKSSIPLLSPVEKGNIETIVHLRALQRRRSNQQGRVNITSMASGVGLSQYVNNQVDAARSSARRTLQPPPSRRANNNIVLDTWEADLKREKVKEEEKTKKEDLRVYSQIQFEENLDKLVQLVVSCAPLVNALVVYSIDEKTSLAILEQTLVNQENELKMIEEKILDLKYETDQVLEDLTNIMFAQIAKEERSVSKAEIVLSERRDSNKLILEYMKLREEFVNAGSELENVESLASEITNNEEPLTSTTATVTGTTTATSEDFARRKKSLQEKMEELALLISKVYDQIISNPELRNYIKTVKENESDRQNMYNYIIRFEQKDVKELLSQFGIDADANDDIFEQFESIYTVWATKQDLIETLLSHKDQTEAGIKFLKTSLSDTEKSSLVTATEILKRIVAYHESRHDRFTAFDPRATAELIPEVALYRNRFRDQYANPFLHYYAYDTFDDAGTTDEDLASRSQMTPENLKKARACYAYFRARCRLRQSMIVVIDRCVLDFALTFSSRFADAAALVKLSREFSIESIFKRKGASRVSSLKMNTSEEKMEWIASLLKEFSFDTFRSNMMKKSKKNFTFFNYFTGKRMQERYTQEADSIYDIYDILERVYSFINQFVALVTPTSSERAGSDFSKLLFKDVPESFLKKLELDKYCSHLLEQTALPDPARRRDEGLRGYSITPHEETGSRDLDERFLSMLPKFKTSMRLWNEYCWKFFMALTASIQIKATNLGMFLIRQSINNPFVSKLYEPFVSLKTKLANAYRSELTQSKSGLKRKENIPPATALGTEFFGAEQPTVMVADIENKVKKFIDNGIDGIFSIYSSAITRTDPVYLDNSVVHLDIDAGVKKVAPRLDQVATHDYEHFTVSSNTLFGFMPEGIFEFNDCMAITTQTLQLIATALGDFYSTAQSKYFFKQEIITKIMQDKSNLRLVDYIISNGPSDKVTRVVVPAERLDKINTLKKHCKIARHLTEEWRTKARYVGQYEYPDYKMPVAELFQIPQYYLVFIMNLCRAFPSYDGIIRGIELYQELVNRSLTSSDNLFKTPSPSGDRGRGSGKVEEDESYHTPIKTKKKVVSKRKQQTTTKTTPDDSSVLITTPATPGSMEFVTTRKRPRIVMSPAVREAQNKLLLQISPVEFSLSPEKKKQRPDQGKEEETKGEEEEEEQRQQQKTPESPYSSPIVFSDDNELLGLRGSSSTTIQRDSLRNSSDMDIESGTTSSFVHRLDKIKF